MSVRKALEDYLSIDFPLMRPVGFLNQEADQIEATVKNVDRGHGWIANRECPLCSSSRSEMRFERFGRKVMQCLNCNVGYMDAFPAVTADVYSHEGYIETQQASYLDNVDYRKKRFAQERLKIVRRNIKFLPNETRLLDVGCGTGWFLEVARSEGFVISGLELGRQLAQFTSKRLGVTIHNLQLTDLPLEEKFDVITLFDVLEHVAQPRAILKSIREHLNEGGIALLFVPNLDSIGIEILRERSSLIMPAEHLFYFTPTSLHRLIEEVPLDVLEFYTKGMDIADLFSYYRDCERAKEVASFLAVQGPMLQAVIDSAGCANHMRYVVRRGKD